MFSCFSRAAEPCWLFLFVLQFPTEILTLQSSEAVWGLWCGCVCLTTSPLAWRVNKLVWFVVVVSAAFHTVRRLDCQLPAVWSKSAAELFLIKPGEAGYCFGMLLCVEDKSVSCLVVFKLKIKSVEREADEWIYSKYEGVQMVAGHQLINK